MSPHPDEGNNPRTAISLCVASRRWLILGFALTLCELIAG